MEVPIMNRPMVIKYTDEESSSYDEDFLKVMGVVKRFSNPSRRRSGPKRKRKERSSYVDMLYI
jgi:hypothetical protein